MAEMLKLGDKTTVVDGMIIKILRNGYTLVDLYYGGELVYPTADVPFALLAMIKKINFDIGAGQARSLGTFVLTSDSFTDKAVKCQCVDETGLFGRWVDLNNWYEVFLYSPAYTADFQLAKFYNASRTILGTEAVDIWRDERRIIKISISGSTIKGYRLFLTEPAITVTDTTFASGAYGILQGTSGGYNNTDAILGILIPPSSPSPPAQRIVEVEVVGTGSKDDPTRPNLKQELVEISKLTNIPEFLKQEAKRYEALRNRGFTDEEIRALLDYVPQHQVDLASVTWGAFDHKLKHNTVLVTITKGNVYVGDNAILKQIEHAKAKNLKVLKPPKDYREAIEQYRQLRRDFPEWLAGKDNYAYQTLGHEVFDYLQVADTYYGRVIDMNDKKAYKKVPDWEMRRTLEMWKEKLKKADVLKEEAEKHLKKLEEVERKGW